MSSVVKMLTGIVTTTKAGRRFVTCPACTALGARVPQGALRFTCCGCGCDMRLAEKVLRPKRGAAT
jgi:hypothetical protein